MFGIKVLWYKNIFFKNKEKHTTQKNTPIRTKPKCFNSQKEFKNLKLILTIKMPYAARFNKILKIFKKNKTFLKLKKQHIKQS